MAESKSNILYKGFTWGNYCDRSDKWLTKSIYDEDVKLERTEHFTYQCNTDRDYEAHLIKKSKDYAEIKITRLVRESKRYEETLQRYETI